MVKTVSSFQFHVSRRELKHPDYFTIESKFEQLETET